MNCQCSCCKNSDELIHLRAKYEKEKAEWMGTGTSYQWWLDTAQIRNLVSKIQSAKNFTAEQMNVLIELAGISARYELKMKDSHAPGE